MESGTVTYEALGFFLAIVIAMGGLLWVFYKIIQNHFEKMFDHIEEMFDNVRNDIREVKSDVKELSRRVERIEEKVNSLDKEIHVFAVFLKPRIEQQVKHRLDDKSD